jgi:hypothetical protein
MLNGRSVTQMRLAIGAPPLVIVIAQAPARGCGNCAWVIVTGPWAEADGVFPPPDGLEQAARGTAQSARTAIARRLDGRNRIRQR